MLASYLMILHSTLLVLLFTVLFSISHVFLRYFHLSTFFWMFLEGKYIFNIYFVGPITNIIKWIVSSGLYLFLQVQMPLTLANFKYLYCILIGWGRQLVCCHCAQFQKHEIVRVSSGYSDNLVHSQISSEPNQHSREHGRHWFSRGAAINNTSLSI